MSSRSWTVWTAAILGGGALLFLGALALRQRDDAGEPARRARRSEPAEATRLVADNRWVVSMKDRDAYLGDLERVTREITLKPEPGEAKDSVSRLVVVALAEGSPLHRAGFRTQDSILKVNGTPIGTMGRAINLVHEVRAANDLSVQVLRGNETLDYLFQFR